MEVRLPFGAIGTAKRLVLRSFREALERRRKVPRYTPVHSNVDPQRHIAEAASWLCRAQDFGSDRGVAWGTIFGQGFTASYPETTGYIICTFLDLARHYGDGQYRNRAIEMGQWEADVQMSSGAVMGGMYNANPTPAIFNTGMVLLGWAALLRETRSDVILQAGHRGANWLLEMQAPDGNWIRGNSRFANPNLTLYNVKAAWGLAEFGVAAGENAFVAAALRNAEFAISKQLRNGWFPDCCLNDSKRPLLHTIGYTMQGLVGMGKLVKRHDLIDAARKTADSLMALMDHGFIPGKIPQDFSAACKWCCLTGTAQTSIVWSELERLTGDTRYGAAAERANRYLMARHDISSPDPSIRGGLAGSWPVCGDYGKYKILNWAVKFLIDALLIRMQPKESSIEQSCATDA